MILLPVFGDLLDHICKFFVHALWQLEAKIRIHDKGDTALSGLGIDSDDRLVLSSDVRRIDRQIRNLPDFALSFLHGCNALVDRILMRTGECSKHKLTCIRMSRMNRDLAASFVNFNDFIDMFNVQLRINALREHIIRNVQNIHITRTFTVSE